MIDGLVTHASRTDGADTVRNVLQALARRGITPFARIDHRAAAEAVGLSLPSAVVIIFGDPRAGTPLMHLAPTLAIDLPLRLLVWDDQAGATWISYNEPRWLGRRHGLDDGSAPTVDRMTQLLEAIVSDAIEPGPR